jgi:hypothetical protein
MRKQWLTLAVVAASASGVLAFAQAQDTAAPPAEPVAEAAGIQPIQFPHDIHAGQYAMDCQYCHFSAERSVDAGIPPVQACMGCHTMIAGTANPGEIEKLRGYAQRQEQIPWVRIYKVADHVHFPHMRHVNAGVTCQTCHGQVQEMGVITERAPEWGAENMGWCISCHVQEGASRDCTVCHY